MTKSDPDYEIDAYLRSDGKPDVLCDLKIWLPDDPDSDGRVEIVAINTEAGVAHPLGLASIRSEADVESAGLRLEAEEVLVRQTRSRGHRKAGGAQVTATHIGRLRIVTTFGVPGAQSSRQSIQFVLSDVDYGMPWCTPIVDYQGNRRVEIGPRKLLRMATDGGSLCGFDLDRHWSWKSTDPKRLSAASSPVFRLVDVDQHTGTPMEALTTAADDACVLFTLAARHRVLVHSTVVTHDGAIDREWRNPLARQRSQTEEAAAGPLIDPEQVEEYFSHASDLWKGLTADQRDVIRLAVFAVHPTTDQTLESGFLSMFSSLEGLATTWGKRSGTLRERVDALLAAHPVAIGGLCPIFDDGAGAGLYGVRNELAHGRTLSRKVPGALVLAQDHLQLWIEHVLLAILGFRPRQHRHDWLRSQLAGQFTQVRQMQDLLRHVL